MSGHGLHPPLSPLIQTREEDGFLSHKRAGMGIKIRVMIQIEPSI
jgi:hypothetical protein